MAKKGKDSLSFYTKYEFTRWESTTNTRGWNVEYKKGLAALESDDYNLIVNQPKVIELTKDNEYQTTINSWFGPDSSLRKVKLLKL